MTTTNQDCAYDDPDTLKQNMAVLFNDPNHGDTMFIIGDRKLYAWSGLISVASPKLGDMIKKNFANRKICLLYQVKNVESFSLVLKYIYGISINIGQTSLEVVCEALKHSVYYELKNLSKNLTEYLSKVNSFSLDSAVLLLNTAHEFRIQTLYDRVKIFAYKNSSQLIKHPRFQCLGHGVLVELLKSDWFYSSEIDILKGVLHWHRVFEIIKMRETLEKEKVRKDVHNMQDEGEASVKRQHTEWELFVGDECLKIKKRKMNENDESSCSTVNKEPGETVPDKKEKCLQTVQLFSEHVLKSLLAHIRISHISAKDMLDAFISIQFKNSKYFSQNCKPRKHIESMHVQHETEYITKIFNVIVDKKTSPSISNDNLTFGDFKLSFRMELRYLLKSKNCVELTLFLDCESTSPDQKDWHCYVECQLTLISHLQDAFPHLVLPNNNADSYISMQLTPDYTSAEIGSLFSCGSRGDWDRAYNKLDENGNRNYTFNLEFKTINIKTIPTEKDIKAPIKGSVNSSNEHQQPSRPLPITTTSLRIYYQNTSGLNTKTHDFNLNLLGEDYDLIVIVESWLSPGFNTRKLFGPQYRVVRQDRDPDTTEKTRGGGLIIAAKTHISITSIKELSKCDKNIESLWVKCSIFHQEIFIGLYYLASPTRLSTFQNITESLDSYTLLAGKRILLIGDFNIPEWVNQQGDSTDSIEEVCDEETNGVEETYDRATNRMGELLMLMRKYDLTSHNNIKNKKGRILDLCLSNLNNFKIARNKYSSISVEPSPGLVKLDDNHPPLIVNVLCEKETSRHTDQHDITVPTSSKTVVLRERQKKERRERKRQWYNIQKTELPCILILKKVLFEKKNKAF